MPSTNSNNPLTPRVTRSMSGASQTPANQNAPMASAVTGRSLKSIRQSTPGPKKLKVRFDSESTAQPQEPNLQLNVTIKRKRDALDVATEQMPSPKIRRTSPEAAEESTPPATSLSNTQIEFFSLKSSPVVGALQQVAPMISKIGRMIGIVESPRILHPAASRGEGITTPPVSCTHTPKLVRVHHEKCEENEEISMFTPIGTQSPQVLKSASNEQLFVVSLQEQIQGPVGAVRSVTESFSDRFYENVEEANSTAFAWLTSSLAPPHDNDLTAEYKECLAAFESYFHNISAGSRLEFKVVCDNINMSWLLPQGADLKEFSICVKTIGDLSGTHRQWFLGRAEKMRLQVQLSAAMRNENVKIGNGKVQVLNARRSEQATIEATEKKIREITTERDQAREQAKKWRERAKNPQASTKAGKANATRVADLEQKLLETEQKLQENEQKMRSVLEDRDSQANTIDRLRIQLGEREPRGRFILISEDEQAIYSQKVQDQDDEIEVLRKKNKELQQQLGIVPQEDGYVQITQRQMSDLLRYKEIAQQTAHSSRDQAYENLRDLMLRQHSKIKDLETRNSELRDEKLTIRGENVKLMMRDGELTAECQKLANDVRYFKGLVNAGKGTKAKDQHRLPAPRRPASTFCAPDYDSTDSEGGEPMDVDVLPTQVDPNSEFDGGKNTEGQKHRPVPVQSSGRSQPSFTSFSGSPMPTYTAGALQPISILKKNGKRSRRVRFKSSTIADKDLDAHIIANTPGAIQTEDDTLMEEAADDVNSEASPYTTCALIAVLILAVGTVVSNCFLNGSETDDIL